MGQKHPRPPRSRTNTTEQQRFKSFEYQCPSCRSKRPIQYFYKDEAFVPQAPRVVCGECATCALVEPFKTVEYECPACRRWQKARLAARPIALNMYNVAVVRCNCGFRGEVSVGRLMDVICSQCWTHKRELHDVWVEDGEEVRTYCETCQDHRSAFARVPEIRRAEQQTDLEYVCENCFRTQTVQAEELLRTEGLACCSLCSWVGYPEAFPKARGSRKSTSTPPRASSRAEVDSRTDKTRPRKDSVSLPMSIMPGP